MGGLEISLLLKQAVYLSVRAGEDFVAFSSGCAAYSLTSSCYAYVKGGFYSSITT